MRGLCVFLTVPWGRARLSSSDNSERPASYRMWSFPAGQHIPRTCARARFALLVFSRDAAPFFVDHAHSLGRRCSVGREMHEAGSTSTNSVGSLADRCGNPEGALDPDTRLLSARRRGRALRASLTLKCGTAPCPGDWQGSPSCGGPLPRRIAAPPHTERGAPPAVDLLLLPLPRTSSRSLYT